MPTAILFLKKWIESNSQRASSAKALAADLGENVETLRKQFRRRGGIALSDFIDDVRLEKAKQLLLTTDMLCYEIALTLGMKSEDAAARWFKGRTRMAPSSQAAPSLVRF
jgi:two-component system response regulator YesN